MARTVEQLEDALLQFLPSQYERMTDLLVAIPGAFHLALQQDDDLLETSTIAGASDIWLTLLAKGYGVDRATGEPDPSLRSRLRAADGSTTRPALLEAVDRLIAPYTDTPSEMIEWFEAPFLDVEEVEGAWCDIATVSGGPQSFLIFIPEIGDLPALDSFFDSNAWLDHEAWLGIDGESPIYAAIVAEVEKKRPAGTRWALVIGEYPFRA
jgi:hypothetical protein